MIVSSSRTHKHHASSVCALKFFCAWWSELASMSPYLNQLRRHFLWSIKPNPKQRPRPSCAQTHHATTKTAGPGTKHYRCDRSLQIMEVSSTHATRFTEYSGQSHRAGRVGLCESTFRRQAGQAGRGLNNNIFWRKICSWMLRSRHHQHHTSHRQSPGGRVPVTRTVSFYGKRSI